MTENATVGQFNKEVLDSMPHLGAVAQRLEADTATRLGFRALYETEFSFVWRSLARLGAIASDLEDMAHDVFLVAWRRMDEYDASRPIRPWLFGIAVRVLANHRRSIGRRREVPITQAHGPLEPATPDAARQHEARELVRRGLAALDLEQRAVLCLHDIEGATMPEVAASLSIPLNTGYSRLRLARERFAREVERVRSRTKRPPHSQGVD